MDLYYKTWKKYKTNLGKQTHESVLEVMYLLTSVPGYEKLIKKIL